jgi:hypothetical protein
MATSMLTLQITKRDDGRFITKRIHSADDPLGVDSSLNQALGTAVREATRMSKEDRCRVAIDVETATGNFRRDQIINPPLRSGETHGLLYRRVTSAVAAGIKIDIAASGRWLSPACEMITCRWQAEPCPQP